MMFSTKDRDNDKNPAINCAAGMFTGGWWNNNCGQVDLATNGFHRWGANEGDRYDLMSSYMMVRRDE